MRRWFASRVLAGSVAAVVVGAMLTIPLTAPVGAATPTTFQDFVYSSSASAAPSADKPQSKLWFNDGAWWGLLAPSTNSGVHIFELVNHGWRDTGVQVDNRTNSTGDALWDGSRLYTASRTGSGVLRVNQLSYDPSSRTYTVNSGFPVNAATGGMESATIAKDTTGTLWATYTQSSKVFVTHSNGNTHNSWVAPFQLPVADTAVTADDISAIIAFNNMVGIMWSNQNSQKMDFATHADGAGDHTWNSEVALSGTRAADDHINLKNIVTDSLGRLFAVTKTSLGDCTCDPGSAPLIQLLVRSASGSWTHTTFGTVNDDHTRPQVLLDETNQQVYVFATAPVSGGTIYYKVTSMDAPSFSSGRGTPFVTWPGASINNGTTTKQPVNGTTGIVVLATDSNTSRYYHAEMAIGGGSPPPPPPSDTSPPTVPQNVTANAVSSSRVDVSWSASSDNVGVTHYIVRRGGAQVGDVGAPTTSFSDTTVAPSTTYSYTVEAFDAAGNGSGQSAPASATTPSGSPPPPPSSGITLRSTSFGANPTATTVSVAAPAGMTAGDVLLAGVAVRGQPTITAPAGWTFVQRQQNSTTMGQAIYTHVVASSGEPSSYTFTLSSSQAAAAAVFDFSGVDTTNPVDVSGGQINASSSSIAAPSITTSAANEVVVGLFGIGSSTTVTAPSGMHGDGQAASTAGTYKVTLEGADQLITTAGATGSRTATAANSAASIGQLIALRAA